MITLALCMVHDTASQRAFLLYRKYRATLKCESCASYRAKNPAGLDRTAADKKYVAEATRRRRRILRSRILSYFIGHCAL